MLSPHWIIRPNKQAANGGAAGAVHLDRWLTGSAGLAKNAKNGEIGLYKNGMYI